MSQLRTAPLFLFAVWGEIQHFSDLKVISLTILNKLGAWPPPMSSCVFIHPSIYPFFLLNWVGYKSFTQKMESPALGHRNKLLLLLLLCMREKSRWVLKCFVSFIFILAVDLGVVYSDCNHIIITYND